MNICSFDSFSKFRMEAHIKIKDNLVGKKQAILLSYLKMTLEFQTYIYSKHRGTSDVATSYALVVKG